jgi:hypothetical protein
MLWSAQLRPDGFLLESIAATAARMLLKAGST